MFSVRDLQFFGMEKPHVALRLSNGSNSATAALQDSHWPLHSEPPSPHGLLQAGTKLQTILSAAMTKSHSRLKIHSCPGPAGWRDGWYSALADLATELSVHIVLHFCYYVGVPDILFAALNRALFFELLNFILDVPRVFSDALVSLEA